MSNFHREFSFEEQVDLLNKAIEKAVANGYKIQIKIWEGYYEREEGFPVYRDIDEYLEDDISIAEALLYAVDFCFGKGGCAEIVASDDNDDCCLYHTEKNDEYLYRDLFYILKM